MTPRHLAMFCLAQLANISVGIFFAFQARNFLSLILGSDNVAEEMMPTSHYVFLHYGWFLSVIPIACVLFIPRRNEEDSVDSVEWSRVTNSLRAAGWLVAVFPFIYGISMVLHTMSKG